MSYISKMECCGMAELALIRDDVDDPNQTIMSIDDPDDQGIIVFSDVNEDYANDKIRYRYGERLAKLIKDAKLGMVLSLPPTINPNSDHKVMAWLWKVDRRRLKAYQNALVKRNPDLYVRDDPYGW